MEDLIKLWYSTGFHDLNLKMILMWGICCVLFYLAIKKNFEPLLLVPIAFGALLANLPTEGVINKSGGIIAAPASGIVQEVHVSLSDEIEVPRVLHPDVAKPVDELHAETPEEHRLNRKYAPGLYTFTPFKVDGGEYLLKDGTKTHKLPQNLAEAAQYAMEAEEEMVISDISGRVTDVIVQPNMVVEKDMPVVEMYSRHADGLYIYILYGIIFEIFPPLIFLGVGALTDFGSLIANPRTLLLGAAAQFGVFATFLGASFIGFSPAESAAIGIIGGADGPTSIFVSNALAPHLMGAIAVAAYSYMALVPVIQPPIMRLLTTEKERRIRMKSLRKVSQLEKLIFAVTVTIFCILLVPAASALIGMLMLGNFLRESQVVDRLTKTAQNELINIVTIFLGTAVGITMSAEAFLNVQTLGILALGMLAFAIATGSGVILAKIMNVFSKAPINPLIGSAGVSAVPMAARVSQVEGQKYDKNNFLLMHAMGPNVAGVIGTAVAAGVFINYFTN